MIGVCYLLHFHKKIHGVQHYLGWALDANVRLSVHQHGNGARLTKECVEKKIGFDLVRVWENGTKQLERKLKKHGGKHWCPICNSGETR